METAKNMRSMGKIISDYDQLCDIAFSCYRKKDYESTLRILFVACGFMYTYNQILSDVSIESVLIDIGSKLCKKTYETRQDNKKILFYDDFGYENKGLMLIYIDALLKKNYKVIYISYEYLKGTTPELEKKIGKENIIYIKTQKYADRIRELDSYIRESGAFRAILYMMPDDVIATSVFSQYKGQIERYLIDATDHAFWIGTCTFDYIIEFRDQGACYSLKYRDIDKNKILLLPYYPRIPKARFMGLPFKINGKKVIYSGGSLYKTFSDDNIYYKIVEYIMKCDDDTIFFYSGKGNSSRLELLEKKFPQRIYIDTDRKDFFEIMKRCYFYLSTYPYTGGQMLQYALLAGKVPMTLISDASGQQTVEDNEESFCIHNVEKFKYELKRSLASAEYLSEKANHIKGKVISPDEFANSLEALIEEKKSYRPIVWNKCERDAAQKEGCYAAKGIRYYRMFCRKDAPILIMYCPIKFLIGLGVNLLNK